MFCAWLAGNAEPKKPPKNSASGQWAPSDNFVVLYLRNYVKNREKNLLSSNISSRCLHNMANLGPLAAEICPVVWGTPANFNRFCLLAALLHSTLVVGVNQTLQRWTEGATYIRQGGHHVGHWPTFLACPSFDHTKLYRVGQKTGHLDFLRIAQSKINLF